jgi:hypothetical protein
MCVGPGAGARCAARRKLVEHAARLASMLLGGANSTFGSRLPCKALLPPTSARALAQVHRPVDAQHFAVELRICVQPQAAALGEHDARDGWRRRANALQLGQHARV